MDHVVFEGTRFDRESDGSISKDTLTAIKRKINGLKRRKDDPTAEASILKLQSFIDAKPTCTEPTVHVPELAVPTVPTVPTESTVPVPSVITVPEPTVPTEITVPVLSEAEPVSPPLMPVYPTLILSSESSYVYRVLEYVHGALRTPNVSKRSTHVSQSLPMPKGLDPMFFRDNMSHFRDYMVTPKIDGERMLFVMCAFRTMSSSVYQYLSAFVSMRGVVYPVSVRAPKEYFFGTIIDGEFDAKKNVYYPFDIFEMKGRQYGCELYESVLKGLDSYLLADVDINPAMRSLDNHDDSIRFQMKPFVRLSMIESLKSYVDRHHCDGLILVNSVRHYERGSNDYFKWKMEPSIDLGFRYTSTRDTSTHVIPVTDKFGIEVLLSNGKTFPYGSKIVLSVADKRRLIDLVSPTTLMEVIVELRIDAVDCKWHRYSPRPHDAFGESSDDDKTPEQAKVVIDEIKSLNLSIVRERRDKVNPNGFLTVMSTISDCIRPLTWSEIVSLATEDLESKKKRVRF